MESERIPPTENQTPTLEMELPSNNQQEESTGPNPTTDTKQTEDTISKLDDITQSIEQRAKAVDETLKGVTDFFGAFHKTIEKINKRLDDMEAKLPHTITKPKPTIKGYYDFDTKTRTYLNKEAANEYSRGKETLDIINRVMK